MMHKRTSLEKASSGDAIQLESNLLFLTAYMQGQKELIKTRR
ncbi:hypothetical protein [uncultured Draconibacterium sp.]|nr:hypothetical protein [uncultured Draconibacterium sp.]